MSSSLRGAASQAAAGATRRPRVAPHAHPAPWGAARRVGGAGAAAAATTAAAGCLRPGGRARLLSIRAAGRDDAAQQREQGAQQQQQEQEQEQEQGQEQGQGQGQAPQTRARRRAKGALAGAAGLPPSVPEPVVLFEGESEVHGIIQIHEVPYAEGIPEELQGTRLMYAGVPARLMGAYRPIGDPHPLTYSAWDFAATLPVLLDEGPIGLFGWGGGTVARLFAEVYSPPPPLVAWDIDPRVVEASRLGFGLEEVFEAARVAEVRVGNPLEAEPPKGGYAGVVVDLFVGGQLLPLLMLEETWRGVRSKLADPAEGRVFARLGPATTPDGSIMPQAVLALNALAAAFDGEVSFIDPPVGSQMDVLAVTGPLPDRREWARAVGPVLAPYTVDWERWEVQDVDARDFPELFSDIQEGGGDGEGEDGEEGQPAGPRAAERGGEGAGAAAEGGAGGGAAATDRRAAAERRR